MFLSSGKDGPSQEAPPGHEVKSLGNNGIGNDGTMGISAPISEPISEPKPDTEKRNSLVMTNIANWKITMLLIG
jgi:hypothetical protein